MMQHKKSKYASRIREETNNHLIRMFAFNEIDFAQVYSVPYITIIDEITEKYICALEEEEDLELYNNYPFGLLMGEIAFEYGTPYISNLLYELSNYFEFMYTRCMKCEERVPTQYCDMEPSDIRECIKMEDDKFWEDAMED